MQVVAPRALTLNRRHPDSRGLVLAMPLNQQRSNGFQDATGKDGSKWAYNGGLTLSSFQTWAKGYGVAGEGTLGRSLLSPLSQQQLPAASDFSFIAQVRLDSAANFQVILFASGITFWLNVGNLAVGSTVGSQWAVGTLTAVQGAPSTVGVRYKNSTSNYQFFLNGAFGASGAGTAAAFSAQAPYLGGGVGGSGGWTGIMSDIRLYNRFMPDDTFRRAYRQPLGIYTTPRAGIKGALAFNAGRFFPFMHPSLQS